MNCNEFERRLQQQLDQRLQPEVDPELGRHVGICHSCRAKLGAWQRVSLALKTDKAIDGAGGSSSRRRVWMPVAATLAAAVMMAFLISRENSDSRVEMAAPSDAHAVAVASADVDPSLWWHTVQDRDWVEQTMPAVRSVRDGVAPLGRSLIQAVTILTSSGGEHLSGGSDERPS